MPAAARKGAGAPVEAPRESPAAARLLVLSACLLFGLSLTLLFSIGIGQSNPMHYPVRQAVYGLVAAAAGWTCSRIPGSWWKKTMPLLMLTTVVLLLMARLVGLKINNAHRWLSVGPVNFQPSELAKLASLVWLAFWLSKYRRRAGEFLRGFLLPAAGLGLLCLLVLIGPDFGTTMLIGGVGVLVMFLGGTRLIYLLGSGALGLGGLGLLILEDPERMSRITSFMNPEKYADDDAYQLMNSLYAFVEGGLWGKGIGNSLQKFAYLPEAHTDFILAILAEELGIIGSLTVLTFFVVIFAAGMQISWRCPDPFLRLIGFGITILITLQACINIGVVTGSMPTKGLPLPFVSYGGSSLVFMSAMIGILVGIATGKTLDQDPRRATADAAPWI